MGHMVGGIQRRGKDGKKISAASCRSPKARRRALRAQKATGGVQLSVAPLIARRQTLLGRFAHLAWQAEAGSALGLYFLRGDISEAAYETGQWYAREAGFARKVIAAPKAEARTTNLGQGGKDASTYEPGARDLRRAARFHAAAAALKHNWPRHHQALTLALIEDLWHTPAQRPTNQHRPAYTLTTLTQALEEVEKWRG